MMTQYPSHMPSQIVRATRGNLAGPSDPITDQLSKLLSDLLQGGDPGSPQYKVRVEFLSDVFSQTGAKFVASPQGKKALDDSISKTVYGLMVPLSLAAFVAGYLLGKRKKG